MGEDGVVGEMHRTEDTLGDDAAQLPYTGHQHLYLPWGGVKKQQGCSDQPAQLLAVGDGPC